MFTGLCAFPLTPLRDNEVDSRALIKIIDRLVSARVDSLGILGSTGSYAYLNREQRKTVVLAAKQHTQGIPMMVGIGAMATDTILRLAEDAQQAGADALLLPVLNYQPLADDEVFTLFQAVDRHVSVPICIYDNPRTTHRIFSDALVERIASLANIASIKIPGLPDDQVGVRVATLRQLVPQRVSIGVSGDAFAAAGLNAGCNLWYSVCGGLFPEIAQNITAAALSGDRQLASVLSERLEPLWALFRLHGSLKVIAAAASILELTEVECLPRPLVSLSAEAINEVKSVMDKLGLR
ncbi:TPA: dihydrodipicolinate synthase family protein [Klebsiella aerogenes]|uniref:dihydrodipicolinate synthase family protein n=1 Tax=Klebsiella aerogenes TaxID=548 RepID=UPI0007B357AA|nr:dihydrodipicolinate synthase family protein [Klebsiella aerogenes]KZQ95800.1 dihydrodipicolinate synthase family protein [Klebsiella aerogenes]HDT2540542.1 dihydrodipicolinate synthase family protein [Klebsiella aerogenes]HEM8735695.1 dihydrodipicolinate synthase family protein [Klebsiella aerogenes]